MKLRRALSWIAVPATFASLGSWVGCYYTPTPTSAPVVVNLSNAVVTSVAGNGSPGAVNGTGAYASLNDPRGVAFSTTTNLLYVADAWNHQIRQVSPSGVVTLLAGRGVSGSQNGTGSGATFNNPSGVVVNASATPTLYVADTGNQLIRQIKNTPSPGIVTTVAGVAGSSGYLDGLTDSALFNYPYGVALDPSGNIYVADTGNSCIREIFLSGDGGLLSGSVSLFAGSSTQSSGLTNGSGTNAKFDTPGGMILDASGNLYVADTGSHVIRKVTSAGSASTFAGNGSTGYLNNTGTATAAQFASPTDVAVDSAGNVYVADKGNHVIREITASGSVITLAGSLPSPASSGTADGLGTNAKFNGPQGVAADAAVPPHLYVADTGNHTIRTISLYPVSTLAGIGTAGTADGAGLSVAQFNGPQGVAVDSSGNVYVADTGGSTIRKITAAGVVSTFAGDGTSSFNDGAGTSAQFSGPQGVGVDSGGILYVADTQNQRIRKIIISTQTVSTLAGSGSPGLVNATGTSAWFNYPGGVAVDSSNVYVADTSNHTIRKIIISTQTVSTLAGSVSSGTADGNGVAASFNKPGGVTLDSSGNLYVADTFNHTIRKIIISTQTVSTLAGNAGTPGLADGVGTNARFAYPMSVVFDSTTGNLYVADQGNSTIRQVSLPAGVVTTIVGIARSPGFADGYGTSAQFNQPQAIAVDSAGVLYIGDTDNQRIRVINRSVTTTFAGSAGVSGYADGIGNVARFNSPTGIRVSPFGNIFVADSGNNIIRTLTTGGSVTTPTRPGSLPATVPVAGCKDGTGTAASFATPKALSVDSSNNIYIADTGNQVIRKLDKWGVVKSLAGACGTAGTASGFLPAPRFSNPAGVVVNSQGSLIVSDTGNQRLQLLSVSAVTTFAGSCTKSGYADGTGTGALFNYPLGLVYDPISTSLYVADTGNQVIRQITTGATPGVVTTLAGSQLAGYLDGSGTNASFNSPSGIAVDALGNVYVTDGSNERIRRVTAAGVVTTLAGSGNRGFINGAGVNACFQMPWGIAVDGYGDLYVGDAANHSIRMVSF